MNTSTMHKPCRGAASGKTGLAAAVRPVAGSAIARNPAVGQSTILQIASRVALRYRNYYEDARAAALLAMCECDLSAAATPTALLYRVAARAAAREVAQLRGRQRTRGGYVEREVSVRDQPTTLQQRLDVGALSAATQHDPTERVHAQILMRELRSRVRAVLPTLPQLQGVALAGALAGHTLHEMAGDAGYSKRYLCTALAGAFASALQ